MTNLTELPARGVIEVAGEDRVAFLQGLVSNDVELVAPGRAIWTGLLTPQGKYLADFFILTDGATLLLDCERAQIRMLAPKLSRFRLRSKVTVTARDDLRVGAAWGGTSPSGTLVAPDPRLPEAGWRLISTSPLPANATPEDWDRHRLALGLPDGTRDLEVDKTVLLEAGFDELHGLSWTKGCYMGQELTARTKYRGLLKRRLVQVEGDLPQAGTAILRDGTEVGTMRSSHDHIGLAVLRLDAIDASLSAAGIELKAKLPKWVESRALPEPARAEPSTS
jgi:folate-binding protein YgfZ